ncbi:MAG: UPF0280 family protein [Sphaerochaetaceae bacterium]|nr:UPF0280 family protein [Sphaerochaetaceae bacterium]
MYQRRAYRQSMGSARFSSFSLSIGESDVWIGFQGPADKNSLQAETTTLLRRLRRELLDYGDPDLFTSFVPLQPKGDLSVLLQRMFDAGKRSGTGPFSSVAGAIAERLGRHLKDQFGLSEIVVENGGDLYIDVLKPLSVQLFAPTSPLSGKLSIIVDPSYGPMGVCTSSGKIGHSISFGRADAVMVACKDAALADAYATAYCNRVSGKADVKKVCEALTRQEEVLSAVVVFEDTLAVGGHLEVGT